MALLEIAKGVQNNEGADAILLYMIYPNGTGEGVYTYKNKKGKLRVKHLIDIMINNGR